MTPLSIVGTCIDPLNNGKVVYMPIETLHNAIGELGYNIFLLQIDTTERPQIISQIENEVSDENLIVV